MRRSVAALLLAGLLPAAVVAGQESTLHAGPVTALAVRDGATVSCSRAGIAVETREGTRVLDAAGFRVFDLAARGRLLVAVGGRPGQTGEVACIRDLDHRVAHWEAGKDLVYAVAIGERGERAAVGLADGRVFEVDLPALEAPIERKRHSAACRAVALHGDLLVTAGLDGNVHVYGGDRRPRVIAAHTAGVDCVLVTADGRRVLSGARDGRVRVHAVEDGRLVRTYQRLGDRVNALCVDPGGAGWLAGLRNGSILRLTESSASVEPVHDGDAPVHALCRDGEGVLVGTSRGTEILRIR